MSESIRGLTVLAAGPKGARFLEGLLERKVGVSRIVSYAQRDDSSNAFARIAARAADAHIAFETSKSPSLAQNEASMIVGWQFLLPDAGPLSVVFHDSLLPRYRGFAPTVAALINGDPEIGVTALRLAEEADSGPILGQRSLAVDYPIKIARALDLQVDMMIDLAVELVDRTRSAPLDAIAQNEARATLSLWRDEEDYWIDWTQPSDRIARTVDALGSPYAGARTLLGSRTITLVDVHEVELPPFEIRQAGKCWKLDQGRPIVLCGAGAIRIDRAIAEGRPIVFDRLRIRFRHPASAIGGHPS